jgi:hypothetical protein
MTSFAKNEPPLFGVPFVECNGQFAIDAENVRCRRAVWLTYEFWFLSILTLLMLGATNVRARHRHAESGRTSI